MNKYPIGLQDFAKLREGDFLYVDKTEEIFKLIQYGSYYFLSRPRRFGKSLLLSTLKYLFQREDELFEGLWIEGKFQEDAYPVIHLSFSTLGYKDMGLLKALHQAIKLEAERFDVELKREGLGPRFRELIQKVSSKSRKIVLLIDEYDKPLVDYIEDIEQAEQNRSVLKSFFSVLKDSDPYLRFFLITGVSKFSRVSLFSDLNHLEDLTLAPAAGSLTGYTQEELEHYFAKELSQMATDAGMSTNAFLAKVKTWYNGYTWDLNTRLYNPFSILNFIKQRRFQNFWWETGTPTFLIKQLKKGFHFDLEDLETGSTIFESYTLENLEWRSLLFQTGYLTIEDYDEEYRIYTLGYPNMEVKDSMFQHLLGAFRQTTTTETSPLYGQIKRSLDKYDLPRLIELIDILFSTIPHQIFLQKYEAFFHAVLHLTFQGLGLLTKSEVNRSKGRLDTVVYAKEYIYVMEFKLNDSADAALNQIKEKEYGHALLAQGKQVIALGVGFSSEGKCVSDWKAKTYHELIGQSL